MAQSSIPVVDVSPFLGGSEAEKDAVSRQVADAFEAIGFMAINGHGVSQELVDDALRASRAFFDLPLEEKRKVEALDKKNRINRGYVAFGAEYFDPTAKGKVEPDIKEGFITGRFDVPDAMMKKPHAGWAFAPNIWPDRPPGLRPALEACYAAMEGLGLRLLEVFARALEVPGDYFQPFFDEHAFVFRTQHYPHQDKEPGEGQLRGGAHTDYGAMAILAADDAPGGLQVLSRRQKWIDVVPERGTFIVNIGDLMMTWTNDRWISNLHRVTNPPREPGRDNRRQSMTLFVNANYDALIECIPTCQGPGNSPRHAPMMAGEYRLKKLQDIAV